MPDLATAVAVVVAEAEQDTVWYQEQPRLQSPRSHWLETAPLRSEVVGSEEAGFAVADSEAVSGPGVEVLESFRR